MSANDATFEVDCPECVGGLVGVGVMAPWGGVAPVEYCRACSASGKVIVKGSSHPHPNKNPIDHKEQYDQLMGAVDPKIPPFWKKEWVSHYTAPGFSGAGYTQSDVSTNRIDADVWKKPITDRQMANLSEMIDQLNSMAQESKNREHGGLFYTSDTPTKPGVYKMTVFGFSPVLVELVRGDDGVLRYVSGDRSPVRDGDGWWCPMVPRQVMESEITNAFREGFDLCMKMATHDWYVAYDQSRAKRVVNEQEPAYGETGGAK